MSAGAEAGQRTGKAGTPRLEPAPRSDASAPQSSPACAAAAHSGSAGALGPGPPPAGREEEPEACVLQKPASPGLPAEGDLIWDAAQPQRLPGLLALTSVNFSVPDTQTFKGNEIPHLGWLLFCLSHTSLKIMLF